MLYYRRAKKDIWIVILACIITIVLFTRMEAWAGLIDTTQLTPVMPMNVKKVITAYDRSTYEGIVVGNDMKRISISDQWDHVQFVFISMYDDPTHQYLWESNTDAKYLILFTDESNKTVWSLHHNFTNMNVLQAMRTHLQP